MDLTHARMPEDLAGIVDVHVRAFPGFFLTLAGRRFVSEYYRAIAEYTGGILLVARSGDSIAGFVSGFADPPGFYAFYRARRRRLAAVLALAVLRRPSLLPRVINNVRRVSAVEAGADEAELSSIGVDPAAGGRGTGQALVNGFIREAAGRGCPTVFLTTDEAENERVIAFYERLGFSHEASFRRGRRAMRRYRIATSFRSGAGPGPGSDRGLSSAPSAAESP